MITYWIWIYTSSSHWEMPVVWVSIHHTLRTTVRKIDRPLIFFYQYVCEFNYFLDNSTPFLTLYKHSSIPLPSMIISPSISPIPWLIITWQKNLCVLTVQFILNSKFLISSFPFSLIVRSLMWQNERWPIIMLIMLLNSI